MNQYSIGQLTQQHTWYLKNQRVEFDNPLGPQVVNESFNYADHRSRNGVHNQNNQELFTVSRNKILKPNYTGLNNYDEIGTLANYGPDDYDVNSPLIIPKPGTTCGYYIVYTTQRPVPGSSVPYCGSGLNYAYNNFYTEIDVTLNNGTGGVVSNGNPLYTCETYFPTPVAVSTELTPGGNRFLYMVAGDGASIKKFLVTNSGITFVSDIYTGSLTLNVQSVELELSHDRTMLAMADNHGSKAFIFYLNSSGDLDLTEGINGTRYFDIPSTSNELTGVEFSPNGFNLFIGSKGDGIYYIDLLSNSISPFPLSDSEDYGNSQLELAYDPLGIFNVYAVSSYGNPTEKMGRILNPNTSPSFQKDFLLNVQAHTGAHASQNSFFDMKHLPKQIDGEDYYAHFTGSTGLCCAANQGYEITSYTAPINATWSDLNNPFGNVPIVRVQTELRIPTGKTIQMVNMEFRFSELGKLIIEPGAKLILTNTTLTSMDCEGLMWPGVELQGNSSVNQSTTTNQGHIILQSNSEINNAHIGISVYGRDASNNIVLTKTGGLIQATNSIFRNNIMDIDYRAYNFHNYGSFRNCQFLTDAAIKNGSFPSKHVLMYHVDGIGFYGCDFKNTTVGLYPNQNRGFGIQSTDAKYKVSYYCTSSFPLGTPCPDAYKDGNVFENLFFGIEAVAANSFYTIDIRYNDFINNTRGMYLGGIDYAIVVNNDVNVAQPIGYSYGLYLDNCTGYKVENNNFNTLFNTSTYGAIVVNSNDGGTTADANEIYRNTFDGFDYSATAALANVQMSNGNQVTNTGLTFRCNSFNDSKNFDILTTLGGISPFQGACIITSSGPHAQANNLFSSTPAAIGDFWSTNSDLFQMNYRYEDGLGTYLTEPRPGQYNLINTTISDCGVFDPLTSCPAKRFDVSKIVLKEKSIEAKSNAEILAELIDGGNKEGLISQINSNLDPGQILNLMLQESPYLSDEVLMALINRTPKLPQGILKQIILANSPVTDIVLNELENSNISKGIMDNIYEVQNGISERNNLESEINYWYLESDLQLTELVRLYLHDTTIVNGQDSVKFLLRESDKQINNKLRLSSLLIKMLQYDSAQVLIDELKLENNEAIIDFCEYQELLISLENTYKKVFTIEDDILARNKAEEKSNKENGRKECYGSTAMLKRVVNQEYQEYIPFVLVAKSMSIENEDNSLSIQKPLVTIFPNPAKDFVTIELMQPESELSIVRIYDLTGKLILTEKVSNTKSYIHTSILKSGTYLLIIELSDKSVLNQKLTIE